MLGLQHEQLRVPLEGSWAACVDAVCMLGRQAGAPHVHCVWPPQAGHLGPPAHVRAAPLAQGGLEGLGCGVR